MKDKKQGLIIGLDAFGFCIAEGLINNGWDVLALDINGDIVYKYKDNFQNIFECDARDKETFLDVVGTTNQYNVALVNISSGMDFSTALVVAYLKGDCNIEKILARAWNDEQELLYSELLCSKIGSKVLRLDKIAAPLIVSDLILPEHMKPANLAEYGLVGTMSEYSIPDKWIGKSITELNVRDAYKINIIAIRNSITKDALSHLTPDYRFKKGDLALIVGKEKDFRIVNDLHPS